MNLFKIPTLKTGVFFAIILSFTVASVDRSKLWIDATTIWDDVSRKSPDKGRVWSNYGIAFIAQDRHREGIVVLKKSVEVDSLQMEPRYNLALCYIKEQMYDEAIDSLEHVLKINGVLTQEVHGSKKNLDYELYSYSNLGNLYSLRGDLPKSISNFKMALRIKPMNISNTYNLAIAYKKAGMKSAAINEFNNVLKYDPNDEGAKYNLSLLVR